MFVTGFVWGDDYTKYELTVHTRRRNSKGEWETCDLIHELCEESGKDENYVRGYIEDMLDEPINQALEFAAY